MVVAFTGAMMPGPLLTVVINETTRTKSMSANMRLMGGHAILEILVVIFFFFGLNKFMKNRWFSGVIGILGGAFLLWMGYGIIHDCLSGSLALPTEATPVISHIPLVVLGGLISLSNPYWSIWWATFGAANILNALKEGKICVVAFYLGHISADIIWYSIIAGALVFGRRFISNQIYIGILFICGAFLLFLALYFLWSGFNFISGRKSVELTSIAEATVDK